jgi:protein-L-isoaspartate(D-aspartate) O-methyltransferase
MAVPSIRFALTILAAMAVGVWAAISPDSTPDSGDAKDSLQSEDAYRAARMRMVEGQLKTRDISDPAVLDAFTIVPRHRFVPDSLRDWAYIDYPLPIGFEQTISQPYIVALMTQLVGSDSSSRVLEIGTGSGYQAAVLAEMVAEVYTIEIVEPLGKRAEALLDTLGYDNVFVRIGDGFKGWPEKAPFDGIVVTCAPPEIPQPLIDQLADNGRLVIPVGTAWQELLLVTKRNGKVIRESITPVRFVPMTGEAEKR